MPALSPVPPEILKNILSRLGFRVIDEDEAIWLMAKEQRDRPIPLPRDGDLVAVEVMEDVLARANMNDGLFLTLLKEVQEENTL